MVDGITAPKRALLFVFVAWIALALCAVQAPAAYADDEAADPAYLAASLAAPPTATVESAQEDEAPQPDGGGAVSGDTALPDNSEAPVPAEAASPDSAEQEALLPDLPETAQDGAEQPPQAEASELGLCSVANEADMPDAGSVPPSDLNASAVQLLDVGARADAPLSVSAGSAARKLKGLLAAEAQQQATGTGIDALVRAVGADRGTLVDGGTYLLQTELQGNRALEVAGGSSVAGANVQTYDVNRSKAQWWKASYDESGLLSLTSYASGLLLGVSGSAAADGANVQQGDPALGYGQKWLVRVNDDDSISLVSALSSPGRLMVLDVEGAAVANGANVQLYADNGSGAQRWSVFDISAMWASLDQQALEQTARIEEGTYAIASALGSGMVLDVAGGSADNRANVQVYHSNMTPAQTWTIRYGADGYATIIDGLGKVVDVADGAPLRGANIQHYRDNGTRAQKWLISPNGDGTYTIASALWAGQVLDVADGLAQDRTNVQLYPSNGARAQKWVFYGTSPAIPQSATVDEGWFSIRSALDQDFGIGLADESSANGANVQLAAASQTLAQMFSFVRQGAYYAIVNAQSGKALRQAYGSVVPGANIDQQPQGSVGTLFSLVENDDGTLSFVNAASGLAASVDGLRAAAGANVQAAVRDAASKAQKFVLKSVERVLANGLYTIEAVLGEGMVASVASAPSSTPGVTTDSYTGAFAQKWQVALVDGASDVYTFESLDSGLMLASTDSGVVARTRDVASLAQQWSAVLVGEGSYTLTNVQTGRVLAVSGGGASPGARMVMAARSGQDAQRFKIASTLPVDDGTYQVLLAANAKLALDVAGNSTSDGANISAYASNDTSAQKFYVRHNADGTYAILNAKSWDALDVADASKASGANVQQRTYRDETAQKWRIVYAGDGVFALESALGSSLVLSADGALVSGVNVVSATDRAAQLQRWRFVPTTYELASASLMENFAGMDLTGVTRVGIDVSVHNGSIDWAAVKASGVEYAILRCGYGENVASQDDARFLGNVIACRAQGIPIGVYLYSYASSTASARSEANHVLRLLRQAGLSPDDVPYGVYYDLEEPSVGSVANRGLLADMTEAFSGIVGGAGYSTGVYANLTWWNNYLTDSRFGAQKHWVAQWRVPSCAYRGDLEMWQCSAEGRVEGISGAVDLNFLYV